MTSWPVRLLCPPDPQRDPNCRAAAEWVADFEPDQTTDGAFVLDHARRKYAERSTLHDRLADSADSLLRVAATAATIVFAAVAAFDLRVGWPLCSALGAFLLAIVAVLYSRRPGLCASLPTIRDVLEGSPRSPNPSAWLAASLHQAAEELRVVNDWKADWLHVVIGFISAGVALLLVALCVSL